MNDYTRRMIIDKRRRDRAYRDGNYDGRGEYRGEIYGEYDGYDGRGYDSRGYGRRDGREYADSEYDMPDGRRGVKYTGPYGIGGRRHYPRRDRAGYDEDYGEDDLRLTKSEMMKWKESLHNADGSHGEHFSFEQIMQAMQAFGLQPKGYNEKELCLAANMLYSDYCKVFEQFIPRDKEAMVYVKMAKAFFDDPDASVKGAEKLAAYFCAIVDDEE